MGDDTAVLVVGAGPVGLVLGCELARRGVAFRLIDKLAQPTDESRAIIVHARSLEMLERVGAVDALIASGIEARAATFHADGKDMGRVDLDTVDSPYPFSISTAQTETERVLTERLAQLGGTVERGVELVGLTQNADGATATLRRPDGSEETVRSGFVVGADGSHSTVRGQLGAKLEGSFEGERFLLGDVEADYDLDRDSIHTFFSANAPPLFVFPMRGDRVRVIAQLDASDRDVEPTLDRLRAAVDGVTDGVTLRAPHWITIFEIHHAQVPHYRDGRVFLAGDAAHVHSPAAGQGMNTGMQDAFNLGWKLALATEGRATEALLDSYHEERHPVAARVIRQTTRMTDLGTLPHHLQRILRNHLIRAAAALAPIRHRLADMTEEVGIAYPDSTIVAPVAGDVYAGPRPGEAAPDVPGLALHAVLAEGAGHTALWIAPPGGAALDAPPAHPDVRHVLVHPGAGAPDGFAATVADPDGAVAHRYGTGDAGGLVLIRPDGYIGLRAALDQSGAANDYLARIAT